MKVDLHCHSYFSDGKQAPEFLVQRAIENKVSHLAITDHDCTAALDLIANHLTELTIINGVEISCQWNSMEIHIVGLLIDPASGDLRELLSSQQQQRKLRMQAMDEKLRSLGTDGLLSYFENLPCISYTRSHVADFLVAEKVCKNRQKAFKSHLGKRGKIYVGSNWCSLAEAIACIQSAGGIAVLAHPGRYPLSWRKLETLVDDFKDYGGEALEGSYSNIDPNSRKRLCELALAKSLYLSGGSDFHDRAAHWTDIGKFPALDQQALKNAIWLHPKWHSLNQKTL
ncbi:MAG: PHP domain-containing protein [Pseudohongiella sp.]|jgi:3',5'-nucleoside bisphosphate phosphatase|nr:PHP domain-containing protein [Pseudohongiella sp.]